MRRQLFNRHTIWTVFFSLLVALGLGACSDVSNAPAPTPLPPGTPVANAGPDLGSITFGTSITLNGSASVDPNGDPLTYRWTLLSKPVGSAAVLQNSTTVAPTFIVDRDGDYIVQLIVNDGILDSAPDTATISSNNVAPVANAGPDQGGRSPNSLVTLNGSASTDANGDPLIYSWSLLTKPAGSVAALQNPTTVAPTFTVDRGGDYIVQLIVNDGTVNSSPDVVLISSANVAPVANAGPDQGGKASGALITLNGSASSDANGDPLTYSWSLTKPAGSVATLVNPTTVSPTFTVDRDGTYTAQLIVNDGTVSSAPDTVNITSDNVAPVANAGPDQGGKAPGTPITLNGSASSDANGDPLTYSWSLTKPAGSVATLVNPTTVSPTFTVDLAGTYTAQLVVNDGTVSSTPDTVNITTNNVAPVANAGPDQGGKVNGSLVTLNGSASSDANGDPLTYS
ncbi:PKD domain-containing protein, partial [Nitrospira lenta]|uniref:PKD domain-containing protein n=1 Tax=Nitrospira lenta TaxID=1436998 RepID=UPI0015E8D958